MPKYTVDGSFFVQQLSGIQRYAREILVAMDPMLEPGELEVAVPPDCIVPEYRNIKVVTLPQSSGILGWQRVYGRYLAQSGRCWLGMCNVIPMFHRGNEGIAVVHDVCYKARPDFYTDLRGRTSAVWHCMQYAAIAKKARKIVTVSEFSKSEIVKGPPGFPRGSTGIFGLPWNPRERNNCQCGPGRARHWRLAAAMGSSMTDT